MIKSKQSILVVDDIPDNIDLLSNLLRPAYIVRAALNGKRAIEQARSEHSPDLILLDIMMPEMGGYEVCRILKSDPATRHIPIIFVTARSHEEDEKYGLELGAADYITKPVNPSITLARIRTQLALANQNRNLELRVLERTQALQESRLTIIRCLARAAEYHDNQTGQHVIRMSHYARLLALAYSEDPGWAELILHAAPMHDIGKIGISDNILLKPDRLTEEESRIMQTHPQIGAEIIGEHDSDSPLLSLAREIALYHHEKWDGSGYPMQLKEEDIPLSARIVAIADVFDALTTERSYKRRWTTAEAMEEIHAHAGKHFDPQLVKLFERILPAVEDIMAQYGDHLP